MKTSGFLGLILRQRSIKRWSLMNSNQPESVLEHSAVVVSLCIIVFHIRRDILDKHDLDLGSLLAKASLHDSTEVLSGDIVTPVKNANSTLKSEFKSFEFSCKSRLLSTLPVELRNTVAMYFETDGLEQAILKGCDIYAALLKARLEISSGNKTEFEDAYDSLKSQFDIYMSEFQEFIILEDTFGKVDLSIDKLLKL